MWALRLGILPETSPQEKLSGKNSVHFVPAQQFSGRRLGSVTITSTRTCASAERPPAQLEMRPDSASHETNHENFRATSPQGKRVRPRRRHRPDLVRAEPHGGPRQPRGHHRGRRRRLPTTRGRAASTASPAPCWPKPWSSTRPACSRRRRRRHATTRPPRRRRPAPIPPRRPSSKPRCRSSSPPPTPIPSTPAGRLARLHAAGAGRARPLRRSHRPVRQAGGRHRRLDRMAARLGKRRRTGPPGSTTRRLPTLKALSEQKDGAVPADGVLMELARAYRLAGKTDDARKTLTAGRRAARRFAVCAEAKPRSTSSRASTARAFLSPRRPPSTPPAAAAPRAASCG